MDKLKRYIGNRQCDLLGLGVSNLPLAEKLLDLKIPLTVRDRSDMSRLGDCAKALADGGARFILGENYLKDLSGELIFRSPGIRPDGEELTAAISKGSELTSEMALFLSLTDACTFGVTGSDGKTTSTTLTGKFLSAEAERTGKGKVFVGGNIGSPLLHRVDEMQACDFAVMELSSFQLMTVGRAPEYSAITNLSPNHLDWHRDMEEYLAAKERIVGENTRRLVTNGESPATAELARRLQTARESGTPVPAIWLFSSKAHSFASLFPYGAGEDDRAIYEKDGWIVLSDGVAEEPLLEVSRIRIPGRHNVENFMTAIGLTYGHVSSEIFATVADEFFGVEHRLELIRTLDGVDYFNSSIDSSPSRTAAALSALAGRDIVIICGGYDKQIPFEPLAESLCRSVRAVVLTGATGKKIETVLKTHPLYRKDCPLIRYEPKFEEAVRAAKSLSRRGGCVLLSPACASFDAFRNFAERGETFRTIVKSFEN